jgi:hypothetical protein
VWGCPERNVAGALTLMGGVLYESFEYMGTLPISCPSSLIIANAALRIVFGLGRRLLLVDCPLAVPLRHAGEHQKCLLIGVVRK